MAPASLTATPGAGQISLSWSDSVGATSYHLKRALISGGPYEGVACTTTTAYTDVAVVNGTTYYYVVSAAYSAGPNAGGESADSSEASAIPQADIQPPTVPSNLTATGVSGVQINLSWTASTDNAGVASYLVERCQGTGCSTFAQMGTTPGTTTTYSDTGLSPNTSYSYRVRATDAAGNLSSYSNVASAVTSSTTINYVQGNYATPQTPQATVTVTFTAVQSAGDLNVVVVGWNDSTAVVNTVTDRSGNTYTRAVGPTVISGVATQSIYYAKNIAGAAAGANIVTVTFSTAAAYADIRIAEYAGIDTLNPVDVTAAGSGNSTTSSSGAATTTYASDLLVGANLVQTGTTGSGTGFTSRMITTPDGDILEDRTVTSTGSYSATAPLTSGKWIMQMVAFKAAN
jgi:fibronectin type 3 domain-containing protein